MKRHDLVAFYQSRETAERVREELLEADFDRDDTKVYTSDGSGSGGGFWDSMKEAFGVLEESDRALYAEAARRGASAVAVSLDDADGPPAKRAVEILQRYKPLDIDQQSAQWRKEGWTGSAPAATTAATTRAASTTQATTKPVAGEDREVIPVIEEKVRIDKRRVIANGSVRIHSRVTERPVEEQVQLRQEHVNVERRPADRPATAADTANAFRERTIEATETREEPVVQKEARVVEEVVVDKTAEQRTQKVRDTARRTEVEVEKIPAGASASATTGASYDEFASEIASDARYRGRDWNSLEPEVCNRFKQRYPGGRWDQAKDSIRRGYDRLRAKL